MIYFSNYIQINTKEYCISRLTERWMFLFCTIQLLKLTTDRGVVVWILNSENIKIIKHVSEL